MALALFARLPSEVLRHNWTQSDLNKSKKRITDPCLSFAVGANGVPLLDRIAEALRQQQHELTEADRVT